jgi:hypothetical protein
MEGILEGNENMQLAIAKKQNKENSHHDEKYLN